MASALELYSDVILPKLQDGHETCEEMDVPRYAAQHHKSRKVVACRMRALFGADGQDRRGCGVAV
jgi:hypothetical protein